MLTNDDLRRMFDELDEQTGAYTSHIEVKFNGRLKTILGRYRHFTDGTPFSFEFSSVLKNLPYDEVKQIVIHEYSHYLRNSYLHIGDYGHDEEFKRIVRALGGVETEPNISTTIQEHINEARQSDKQFQVYCPCCGYVYKTYKTKASATKFISKYVCGDKQCNDCKLAIREIAFYCYK